MKKVLSLLSLMLVIIMHSVLLRAAEKKTKIPSLRLRRQAAPYIPPLI